MWSYLLVSTGSLLSFFYMRCISVVIAGVTETEGRVWEQEEDRRTAENTTRGGRGERTKKTGHTEITR